MWRNLLSSSEMLTFTKEVFAGKLFFLWNWGPSKFSYTMDYKKSVNMISHYLFIVFIVFIYCLRLFICLFIVHHWYQRLIQNPIEHLWSSFWRKQLTAFSRCLFSRKDPFWVLPQPYGGLGQTSIGVIHLVHTQNIPKN